MEAEKLKMIAEGMGWTEVHIAKLMGGDVVLGVPPDCTFSEEYTANDSQCMEIMGKLIKAGWGLKNIEGITLMSNRETSTWNVVRGKTINEAVCNAAYEYFKGA